MSQPAVRALAPLPFELVFDDGEPLESEWHARPFGTGFTRGGRGTGSGCSVPTGACCRPRPKRERQRVEAAEAELARLRALLEQPGTR